MNGRIANTLRVGRRTLGVIHSGAPALFLGLVSSSLFRYRLRRFLLAFLLPVHTFAHGLRSSLLSTVPLQSPDTFKVLILSSTGSCCGVSRRESYYCLSPTSVAAFLLSFVSLRDLSGVLRIDSWV